MSNDYRHRARKRFGQNFLVDDQIIARIVAAVAPRPDDTVAEIGPGQGAITGPLLATGCQLNAVELDYDLAALLTEKFATQYNFHLHQGDALNFDFAALATGERPLRVVGNLPYNISTPLLFHLLRFITHIADMHFMLQKEVVQRMAAEPATKAYGRLSVILQYYCHVDYLFTVPPGAFRPAPKVESAIVRLIPRREPAVRANNETFFQALVKTVFQQRRKTLRNNLKQMPVTVEPEATSIDLSRRPETLAVAEFVTLANELERQA